jgi:hypothetical protein
MEYAINNHLRLLCKVLLMAISCVQILFLEVTWNIHAKHLTILFSVFQTWIFHIY